MLHESAFIVSIALVALAGIVLSCRQSDMKTVTIHVPQMTDATSIRIVTNAALNEAVARNDGVQHAFEVNLAKKTILYHEGTRLLSGDYQKRIESRLGEVGLEAKVIRVSRNPPPPFPTPNGPVQLWGDRCTAVISIAGMTSRTAANIAVDAIAYARYGKDDPRIAVQASDRNMVVTYESLHLAPQNIELAIACVGFDANRILANLGYPDAPPHDWREFDL